MRIVHVETGRHLYGGGQQVLYLLKGLADRGVENIMACASGGALAAAARAEGHDVAELSCRGELDVGFLFRLRRLIERTGPDILHAHSRRGADWYTARAAPQIPAVLSRRVDTVEHRVTATLRTRGYRKIVAISENVSEALRESGVLASRIELIRSAVDNCELQGVHARETWRRRYSLSDRHICFVMGSQFIARKGHDYALAAFHSVWEQVPSARLLLFGRGPLEESVRRDVSDRGLQDAVVFAGFDANLSSSLQHADVLLHPATREGLGVIMLQAAAAGIPVVAFNVGGAREAVAHKSTGLLVQPGSISALAEAMRQLAEDRVLRRRLGEAGRERMLREFSIHGMVEKHVELYESLRRE